jgi:hypothetical protein
MNIIWNKLNELKPTYWIHLEDDWLFFKPENYIEKSIQFLEKYKEQNIHQILFNKNYAETIDNYSLVGGTILDNNNDYLLHIKDEPNLNGINSSYWPHYSFRPSMVLVDTILKLGDYSSNNTFFERTYADKYFANGYKSAFFNEITSIHIGKLTSEKNDNTKKNAYQLNSIDQFDKNLIDQLNQNSNIIQSPIMNFEKINNNYMFIRGFDHYGDDIDHKPNMCISEWIDICNKNEDIICFNTLGYIKNKCNVNTFIRLNNMNNGIVINMERLNKKYGIKFNEVIST